MSLRYRDLKEKGTTLSQTRERYIGRGAIIRLFLDMVGSPALHLISGTGRGGYGRWQTTDERVIWYQDLCPGMIICLLQVVEIDAASCQTGV